MTSPHGPEYDRLRARLKQARKEAGLTQAAAAVRLGWSQSTLSKLEKADAKLDALDLKRLADLYDKPLDWFYLDTSSN